MKKLLVKQTRSVIGRDQRVRGTLHALGLGNIGNQKEHTPSKAVLGMIARVKSLLEVREVGK